MDASHAVLAALGLLIAGFVKGATGLGYATCALPFLVAAIGLKAAIVIVPIPAMAANMIRNAGRCGSEHARCCLIEAGLHQQILSRFADFGKQCT